MLKNDDFNSVNPVTNPPDKVCKGKCGKLRPLSDFNNNRTKRDGKQEICRHCQSDFMKDYNARKAYERKQELTAGDIQLDPKPAPLSSAGKLVRQEAMKAIQQERPATNGRDLPKKVNLPDKKVEKQAEKADPAPGKVKLPNNTIKASDIDVEVDIVKKIAAKHGLVVLSGEEKAVIMSSLDRQVTIVEGIIEKLSR